MKTITCAADLEGLSFPYKLQGADFRNADLRRTDFYGANLRNAIIRWACLECAYLQNANLAGANLFGTILRGTDLTGANLWGADLRNANLSGADLTGADFSNAALDGANLEGAKLPEFLVKLPPLGQSFIAWKKVRDSSYHDIVLKLEIPADSPRVSTFISRKCRAKSAKVLEAFEISGEPTGETKFQSLYDFSFIYRVGKTIEVPDFDDDIRLECTRGIHFFETREEAEKYGR